VRRRAVAEAGSSAERFDDLLLADWFSGQPADAAADVVWSSLTQAQTPRLRARKWETPSELQELLVETLVDELRLSGPHAEIGFEVSLGGSQYGEAAYFRAGRDGENGAAAHVESWQLLSPVRG
jgi:ATP-dependent exoDNAse (exonuclease V) alpha subunit